MVGEGKSTPLLSSYAQSPIHLAIITRDHDALSRIVSSLPFPPNSATTITESLTAELRAKSLSSAVDFRDVPRGETPLHLAVRLRDELSVDILIDAGARLGFVNDDGWTALQEAICSKQENIVKLIVKNFQILVYNRWNRRIPRLIESANSVSDFHGEIVYKFESSLIPFIDRILPSDTFRVWKRGSCFRIDSTFAGFVGFRIRRLDQSFYFFGEGCEIGGRVLSPGSMVLVVGKEKVMLNLSEEMRNGMKDSEVERKVKSMLQSNVYSAWITMSDAEVVRRLDWRRQEKFEMVGNWSAKAYDMRNVSASFKSRRVPGSKTDIDEPLSFINDCRRFFNGGDDADHGEASSSLTAEEKEQLENALGEGNCDGFCEVESVVVGNHKNGEGSKKSWIEWKKRESNNARGDDEENSQMIKKLLKAAIEGGSRRSSIPRSSSSEEMGNDKKGHKKEKKSKGKGSGLKNVKEFKISLKPVLWLTSDFPLKTDELLPLLEVLGDGLRTARRLKEFLASKVPHGTFPVKIAIPIIPTITILMNFTKFEVLQPSEKFPIPPSGPAHFHDSICFKEEFDPFSIPSNYTWIDYEDFRCLLLGKKAKIRKEREKPEATEHGSEEGYAQMRN
ncbi:Ankyrin repeat [Dillenia turbinata]|uniref:Ankyrin repeat n=1 Tax=Dillenia turbinata TaxID=194707 RepID=A0AAN8UJR8_9MAGN